LRTATPDDWRMGSQRRAISSYRSPRLSCSIPGTSGASGTGTHHFAVHEVFVPEERSVLTRTAPLIETGPLYQITRGLVFASGDAAVALGVARTCLATFYELAGAKTPRFASGLLREQPMVQVDVGHAEA